MPVLSKASETVIDRLRSGGIVSPELCLAEAEGAQLPLHLAAALLEKETGGGHNVFGHQPGRDGKIVFPGRAGTVKVKVTEELYAEYKRRRIASGNREMQGVGPCQITWWELQDRADALGGCWRPQMNMRVAFGHLATLIRKHGEADGARRYNGAGPPAEAYSADLLQRGAAWQARLEGSAPAPALASVPLAGYVADSVGGDDLLGLHPEVRALCAVISAKSVSPPLSIGLFGSWGSGKSFFMDLMKHEIARLTERSRKARATGRDDPFCEEVVQIDFNAWHYLDANLWASLMARIWERLAAHGDGTTDEPDPRHKELLKRLETSGALLREAQRDADDAQLRVDEALDALDALAQERGRMHDALGALAGTDVAGEVAGDPSVRSAIAGIERAAGLPEGALDLAGVEAMAANLRGVGRVRVVWSLLRERKAWRRALVAIALVLLGIGLALILAGPSTRTADTTIARRWNRTLGHLAPANGKSRSHAGFRT